MSRLSSKNQTIEGIGTIIFTRRRNSRRVTLRVKPDGVISVNYPWYTPYSDAVKFVLNNKQWIENQRNKYKNNSFFFKPGDIIESQYRSIKIIEGDNEKPLGYVSKNEIILKIPTHYDVRTQSIQKFISKVITETCRTDAKMYLPDRVHQLAGTHNLAYKKVFIKNLKSKWGSCSSAQNINLSLLLVLLPSHLIDYIILHELAHTRHMNHSKAYWDYLDTLTEGKAKKYDREMKNYQHLIKLTHTDF
jgi:hypothetical protein